jgi:hypothetical protein
VSFSVDNSVTISSAQCQRLGHRLGELQPKAETFLESTLFPAPGYDREEVAHFFFFITGIDHRTSPLNQSFEGTINGRHFQGADLLWHLSLRKFNENPQSFHPEAMAQITDEMVADWYSVKHPVQVTIRNPEERAALLRNGGKLLLERHEGSVLNLLEKAERRVSAHPEKANSGLLHLLSQFKAYEDPARKKSYLFLKFLLRRNLWTIIDEDQIRIPVDNHLTRIALRTNIITVSSELAELLRAHVPISLDIDVMLREKIGDAYSQVGQFAKRSVLELDDFFWHFGRQCCVITNPICVSGCTTNCFVVEQLLQVSCRGKCPLSTICPASTNDEHRELVEPKLDTWYY